MKVTIKSSSIEAPPTVDRDHFQSSDERHATAAIRTEIRKLADEFNPKILTDSFLEKKPEWPTGFGKAAPNYFGGMPPDVWIEITNIVFSDYNIVAQFLQLAAEKIISLTSKSHNYVSVTIKGIDIEIKSKEDLSRIFNPTCQFWSKKASF